MKTKIVTVFLSIVFSLFVAEVAFRLLDMSKPEFNRLDFELGWMPRAGIAGKYSDESQAFVAINREGFRDIDHDEAKPANVFRVAILGDSFTEAREVDLDHTYWKILERGLEKCLGGAGRDAEVLSFGVNGYGTAQELIVLDKYVWKYKPDLVLLAFFTGNDVWNNSRALDGHSDRPYFEIKNGSLVLDDTNLRSARFESKKLFADIKHGIYNSLRVLQVGRKAYEQTKIRLQRRGKPLDKLAQLNSGFDTAIFAPPRNMAWEVAWRVTEELIEAMRKASQARNVEFSVVTMSTPVQIYPDAKLRRDFAASLGVGGLDYPDRRLSSFGVAHDIPVISLVDDMRRYVDQHGRLLHGSTDFAGGHWNRTGHVLAGEIIARRLCAKYVR